MLSKIYVYFTLNDMFNLDELGNYAVLIKCGFSHYQALLFNLLSATTCIIGFYIGVAVSNDPAISDWILTITIGLFLYISLVELVNNNNNNNKFLFIKLK
jgi:zinc transporter ZupT